MADALAELYVSLVANTAGFTAGVRAAAAEAEAASAKIVAAMAEAQAAVDRMAASQATAAQAASASATEMAATEARVGVAATEAATVVEGADAKMVASAERAASAKKVATDEQIGLNTRLMESEKALRDTTLTTSEGMAGAFGKSGTAFAGLAALVGFESVKMASDFEQHMTRLATQAHVPVEQLGALGDVVLDVAAKVGEKPGSLADAMFHIQSSFAGAGLSVKQSSDILTTAAQGARLGGANIVDVTNALDAAIVSGIPGVQDYTSAMGMLNATVGAGDMTMQDLANAMGTGMLAVTKGYGVTMRDAAAALAVFGDNNIRGAQAGTQFRMSVQALTSATPAGVKNLKDLGMTAGQLATDMQHGGLDQAMTDLHTHMEAAGITGVKVGKWLTDSFGKRAGAGISVLMGQYDRFEQKLGEVDKGANQFGDDWAKQQETAAQKTADLMAAVDVLAIRMGNALLPR